MKRLLLAEKDYERLDMLLENPTDEIRKSEAHKEFKEMFLAAVTMPEKSISDRIVTMNSKIKLRNLLNKNEMELTLVFPEDVNDEEYKVSVFSDVGTVLLGRALGDIVTWPISDVIAHFEIITVEHAPKPKRKNIFQRVIHL